MAVGESGKQTVSGNEQPLGTYGRIITSFGPDGSVNFAPRS